MKRVFAVLFVAGVAVMTVDSMAQAKPGEGGDITESAAISGPGLSGPVGLDKANANTYLDLSRLFEPDTRMHVRPTAVALGPRFDLLLTMACTGASGTGVASIHQDLYPYASFRGQPQVWTFTPSGQEACSTYLTVAGGWNAARRGLFDALVAAGLPPTAPAPVSAPVPSPIGQPDPFWPVAWTIAGLAILVLIGVVLGRPRRRARVLS
jgi:hypothetical protein